MVHDGDEGPRGSMVVEGTIEKRERGMNELVLEEQIVARVGESLFEKRREIRSEVEDVTPVRDRDHFDFVARGAETLHELSIVEVSSGHDVEASVDDQSDAHWPSSISARLAAALLVKVRRLESGGRVLGDGIEKLMVDGGEVTLVGQ